MAHRKNYTDVKGMPKKVELLDKLDKATFGNQFMDDKIRLIHVKDLKEIRKLINEL